MRNWNVFRRLNVSLNCSPGPGCGRDHLSVRMGEKTSKRFIESVALGWIRVTRIGGAVPFFYVRQNQLPTCQRNSFQRLLWMGEKRSTVTDIQALSGRGIVDGQMVNMYVISIRKPLPAVASF